MSMATRCTSCGTIFRVVQDQLKVSEGWVRCGRCDQVFNALEGLFDLDRETPPQWKPAASDRVLAELAQRRQAEFDAAAIGDEDVTELDEDDRIASRFFRPDQDDVERSPAESVAARDRVDFADAQFNTDLLNNGDAEPKAPAARPKSRKSRRKSAKSTPAFLRQADAQARWRTPRARALLTLATLLLLATLTLQVGHHFRDQVAARWPQTGSLLATWCAFADCRIGAPRRIDDVAVESTALTLAANGTDSFRLAVTLRNLGALAVAMPSIDLTLTDASGQLVARRALAPDDFPSASAVLPAGAEAPLQIVISAGNPGVTGYTVELFYP